MMQRVIHGFREKEKRLRKELRERMLQYILAALGLVAGLAWNDAIKTLIESIFPVSGGGIVVKFIYAVVVTIFIVIITLILMRLMQAPEPEAKK